MPNLWRVEVMGWGKEQQNELNQEEKKKNLNSQKTVVTLFAILKSYL